MTIKMMAGPDKDDDGDDEKGLDVEAGVKEIAGELGLGDGDEEEGEAEGGEEVAEGGDPAKDGKGDDPAKAAAAKGKDKDDKGGAPAAAAKPKESSTAAAEPGAAAAKPTEGDKSKDIPATMADGLPQELRTWRPEARKHFNNLPPEVKEEILKRERDIDKGLKEAQVHTQVANAFRETLKPFMPTYQRYNIDPLAHINQVLRAQMVLYFGTPEQKTAILRKAAQDFGVPFEQLGAEAPAEDTNPQVSGLAKEVATVSSTVKQMQEGQRLEREAALKRELDAFAADPAHPYFDEVSERVLQLLQSRVCGTLQEAYDQAVWTNPVVRAKLQAAEREKAEADAKAKREADEAAKAKATAANVTSRPKQRGAAAPAGTMDETMEEVMAGIRSRS